MVKDKHNIECLCSLFFVLISKSNWRIIVSIWVDKCNVCLLKKEEEEEKMEWRRCRHVDVDLRGWGHSLLFFYNDSMIYLGHYSSLLVLPFSFLYFSLSNKKRKSFFFFLLLLSPVGDVNKVLEQECKTWCLVRMLTNEIFFLNSLSTNRVDERKESINRVYNKKQS